MVVLRLMVILNNPMENNDTFTIISTGESTQQCSIIYHRVLPSERTIAARGKKQRRSNRRDMTTSSLSSIGRVIGKGPASGATYTEKSVAGSDGVCIMCI